MNAMKELVPDVEIERDAQSCSRPWRPICSRARWCWTAAGCTTPSVSISILGLQARAHRDGQVLIDGGSGQPVAAEPRAPREGRYVGGRGMSAPRFLSRAETKVCRSLLRCWIASSEIMQQHIARLMWFLINPTFWSRCLPTATGIFGILPFERADRGGTYGEMRARSNVRRPGFETAGFLGGRKSCDGPF